jgi:hypothetical protein
MKKQFAGRPVEPAELDPGPGWLRSRFCGLPWPRPVHEAPCGRSVCPVCGTAPFKCEGLLPEPMELSDD